MRVDARVDTGRGILTEPCLQSCPPHHHHPAFRHAVRPPHHVRSPAPRSGFVPPGNRAIGGEGTRPWPLLNESPETDMDSPLRKFGITRSIKDRVFLGVLGLLFGVPTGYGFFLRFSRVLDERPVQETDIWDHAISWLALDAAAVVFILSACAIVWALAAPSWLEARFFSSINRFVQLLFISSILVLAMFI